MNPKEKKKCSTCNQEINDTNELKELKNKLMNSFSKRDEVLLECCDQCVDDVLDMLVDD